MEDMAQPAITPGRTTTRRRAFFGLFDADGWTWASLKAGFWFILLIFTLGYIPDRAYYFTVERTLDIGILGWSPINLCPPENEGIECPAPPGATLPWHLSPDELRLPEGRTDGSAVSVGRSHLYIGGTDGETATADTYITNIVGTGNFAPWREGPALPEPRANAAAAIFDGVIYLVGGNDADGNPTTTTYRLEVAQDGTPGEWEAVDDLALPEPRAHAAMVPLGDGLVLIGGEGEDGPVVDVWKATAGQQGALGGWTPQGRLLEPNADGVGLHVGEYVWLLGGRTADGPVATVQVGVLGSAGATAGTGPLLAAAAEPAPTETGTDVTAWRASPETNLPAPRSNATGFTANGVLYLIGGVDAAGQPQASTWWAIPDAAGAVPGWREMEATNLGQGIEGSSAFAAGSYAFTVAGRTASGVTADSARANLAPQEPFFQLGILGATIPALSLEGEIGQQIGYLNAATVGMGNFVLMLVVAWAFNHKEQTRALVARIRNRRR
jgi:hypothetical protein